MNILPFTNKDIPYILPLQPDGWPDLRTEFKFYTKNDFCHPVKVVDRARVIGIGVLIVFERTGWLAHIIVDSEKRNRGIGRFIVHRLLDMAKEKKCRSVSLIATDLGYPVYLKAGFVEQTRYLFFSRENGDDGRKAANGDGQAIVGWRLGIK